MTLRRAVASLRASYARNSRRNARPRLLLLLVAATGLLGACGTGAKTAADSPSTAPAVAVVTVQRKDLTSALSIASEFEPYQEIDVYAKVSGYVQKLYVDWGTRVHKGDLLALLEIPELEQQIQHDQAALQTAREELNRAQSAYNVTHLTYERLAGVQKTRPELISQQDIDVAQGKDLEATAAASAAQQELLAAKAALDKDKTLYGYARMTAPFDGVVTQMHAYTGALLPAGTSSNIGNSALCHLAQNDVLRLVIPVPERAVPSVHLGESVTVEVSGLNRSFKGEVARISDQIDLGTRTMHTEVDVPNRKYDLVPGMYATVELPLQAVQNALTVPAQAVQRLGEGRGSVLVVGPDNRIEKRDVALGLDDSRETEVTSGLQEGERVVFGEQAQFKPGELVSPTAVMPSASGGN